MLNAITLLCVELNCDSIYIKHINYFNTILPIAIA